jgi:Domain of unknown function (DUF4189)
MRANIVLVLLAAATFLGYGTELSAEGNCPPGYYQTGATDYVGCAPLPGQGGTAPPDPGPEWATRWGAIATANGAFGTANNLSSARKAEKTALNRCKANGGKDCKINLSFGNQCAALAWGTASNYVEPAADILLAENGALKSCGEVTQDCKIFYSACSYPERKR